MKQIKHRYRQAVVQGGYILLGWLVTCTVWADNQLIPISQTEETKSGTSVATTILLVLQTDVLPIVEIVSAMYILWKALSGLWKGYQLFQAEREMGPLKEALVAATIIVVVGGVILYLLDALRTYPFNS